MWTWASILLIVVSYFLGGIPLQYLLAKLKGVNLSGEYDMHIALFRKVGPALGIIGAVGDITKGFIPIIIANLTGMNTVIAALAGLSVVTGQMWSIFNKFDGEKGNTTGIGMALALAPRGAAAMVIVIAIGAFTRTIPRLLKKGQTTRERLTFGGPPSNSLPIGMCIGFGLLPFVTTSLFSTWFGHPLATTLVATAMFVLVLLRRATADVKKDFSTGKSKTKIVLSRLLLDRSFYNVDPSQKELGKQQEQLIEE